MTVRQSRHAGNCKCSPKSNRALPEVVEIEATNDAPIFIDKHVKNASPGLLFGQKCAMSLSELLTELVAAIADRFGEVGPVACSKARTADS